jgi:DNA repair protein RadC
VKPFDPDLHDQLEFDARQLDLPLGGSLGERDRAWDANLDWPSPHQALGRFLEGIGLTHPLQIAGVLIRNFGSAGEVMSASWWRLRAVVGSRAAHAITASRELMRIALTESVARGPVISTRADVVKLLSAELGSLRRERIIALYVDSTRQLLRIKRISDGTVRDAPLNLTRIIHCGLDVGACGLLVVHNHPSGDPTPSELDRAAMIRLGRIAADLDMYLIDALVIAGRQCVSILNTSSQRACEGASGTDC